MAERGKYIVIEGHDGTGKSTQVELVRARLCERGVRSVNLQEPEGLFDEDGVNIAPIAAEIRTIIKNGMLERTPATDVALFSAARAEMWSAARQKIEAGLWVVAARNYFSTLAYQGYADGQDIQMILSATKLFTDEQYMTPDLAVILTMDDDTVRAQRIAERGPLENPDTFEMRADDFQKRVHDGYRAIADKYELATIDAGGTREDVTREIMSLINH